MVDELTHIHLLWRSQQGHSMSGYPPPPPGVPPQGVVYPGQQGRPPPGAMPPGQAPPAGPPQQYGGVPPPPGVRPPGMPPQGVPPAVQGGSIRPPAVQQYGPAPAPPPPMQGMPPPQHMGGPPPHMMGPPPVVGMQPLSRPPGGAPPPGGVPMQPPPMMRPPPQMAPTGQAPQYGAPLPQGGAPPPPRAAGPPPPAMSMPPQTQQPPPQPGMYGQPQAPPRSGGPPMGQPASSIPPPPPLMMAPGAGAPPPGAAPSGPPRPPALVPMMPAPPGPGSSGQISPGAGGGVAPPPTMVGGGVVPGYDYNAAPVEGMASLSLGTGAGEQLDPSSFPRPTGDLALPPLQGSCDPIFMRMTVNALPTSAATRQRFGLPTAVLIQPLANNGASAPVVNPDGAAIVRCRRCRTYINPFCAFTDGGRRWRCNCCAHLNEVPAEYFCPLDSTGRRRDCAERPELCCGSVEYIAPAEYMVRPPMPPSFFFVLDVSPAAVSSGYLPRACATIKACLDKLPGDGRTQIGLLTFDSTIQFYALRPGASAPHVMVVADTQEPFLPCPDDLLVNLGECRPVVEAALDLIPAAAAAASGSHMAPAGGGDCCLGPAVQAALLAIQHVGGKLLLFSAALPSVGDGKCKHREDARLFGTDREHSLRNPEDAWYKKMAAECSRVQVCVDLWALGAPYTDLASLCVLPKYTGGDVHHMPGYNDAVDGARLETDLIHNLTRETAWEAVMRVRCSKGFRITAFHGHFFVRSTDLLGLPAADADKAYAIQVGHEETVAPPGVTYLQCALLHTTSSGERRIRVHTLAVPVVNELSDMFRAVDGGAMAVMVAKLAIERSYNARLEECRASCVAKVVTALKEYRSLHPGASRAYGRLVYPDCCALLPLFVLALTKCAALRGGFKDVGTDVRSAAAFDMIAMSSERLLRLLYPTAYALHLWQWPGPSSAPEAAPSTPPLVPLSAERVDARGWYLLDDGQALLLWVGASAPAEAMRDLLACGSAQEAQHAAASGALRLRPAGQGEKGPAAAAASLIARLRAASPVYMPLRVAIQGGAGDAMLFAALVEDRGQGTMSYAEHLLQMHRSVQTAPRT